VLLDNTKEKKAGAELTNVRIMINYVNLTKIKYWQCVSSTRQPKGGYFEANVNVMSKDSR